MKDVIDTVPESSKPGGFIQATLAIPEKAVRVIAAPPVTLTQRNVEAVTGLSSRVYLEVIREPTFPLRVAKLGKLRIVNRAAFVEWLEQQSAEEGIELRNDMDEVVPSNKIGGILEKVGLERRRELPKRRNGSSRRGR